METEPKTHEEMRAELIGKAAADADFRERLVTEPKDAIKEALGLDLPDAVTVQVHQNTATTAHLVLPPSPELSAADLESIAAGHPHPRREGVYVLPSHVHPDTGETHGYDG